MTVCACGAEDERDALRVRVQELEADLAEARGEVDIIADGIAKACLKAGGIS